MDIEQPIGIEPITCALRACPVAPGLGQRRDLRWVHRLRVAVIIGC